MGKKFENGDIVKIKSLEQLKADFDGDINSVAGGWNPEMEQFCGTELEVQNFALPNGLTIVGSVSRVGDRRFWIITEDMVERVLSKSEVRYQLAQLKDEVENLIEGNKNE